MIKNPKRKGSNFERKVKKAFQQLGWEVIRQTRSAFPDLICFKHGETWLVECKYNKYISKEERDQFAKLDKHVDKCLIAYPEKNKTDKRKTNIVICDLNYAEVMRL